MSKTATADTAREVFAPADRVRVLPAPAPAAWPLDTVNAYGETRAAAIGRVLTAVNDAADAVGSCEHGAACEGATDLADARADLATITLGDRVEFSLDGRDAWSWTVLADVAADAASRAEAAGCHW